MTAIVVLDVGKTMSKLTLWSANGELLARDTMQNARRSATVGGSTYASLDVEGIEQWLLEALSSFARKAKIGLIIPVGHGAAAVIVNRGRIALSPMDYESPLPVGERQKYDEQRNSLARTGSPRLPDGLNLGAQLHHLEALEPAAFENSTLLLWPQYWGWFLSGIAASETTSLGCHTDLWFPGEGRPSDLAVKRGWAAMLPPIRRADEALGPIRAEIAERTGLPRDTQVYCGIHDSNAALVAARAFPEIGDHEATVLSTGTWFVSMRSPGFGSRVDIGALPEFRDCLVNVDILGRAVPSSRFMGGREIEILTGIDTRRIDIRPDQPDLVAAVGKVVADGATVLPTFAPGVGPYPAARGRWIAMPDSQAERRAAVSLYAALLADASLDLIGSSDRILIEGRFAEAEVFVRGLASLRPDTKVYVANARNDVSFGALRLLNPNLRPKSSLRLVEPLESSLAEYRTVWRERAEQLEHAA